jgi:kynureninase
VQIGTIPILAAAPLWGVLEIVEAAGIGPIREKSVALTSFLIECVDELLSERATGVRVGSPRDPERRGGHVAVEYPGDAAAIPAVLESRGVVADYRPRTSSAYARRHHAFRGRRPAVECWEVSAGT